MTRAAAVAALGAVLIAGGTAFDTPSLHVPGVALLVLSLGAATWVGLAALGAGVERVPGPHTVEEDRPYPLVLERRDGVLPPPGGTLTDPLLAEPIAIGPATPRRVRIEVRFARRGRRTLQPATLAIFDPLRLAMRSRAASGPPGELLVLPRVEPVLAPGGGSAAAGAGRDGSGGRLALRGRVDGSAAELDLDGLRPYRLGTPASRIHWPAVARSGQMLERRLTAESDSAPLIVLDTSRPGSEEALDMAVRAAASLCVHLGRGGGCALLLPGDRRPISLAPDMSAWPSLHARLALVDAATTARPPLSRARRAGAVIWVSARADAPRDLVAAAGGGGFHVTPQPSPLARPAFSVAGCSGSRVGRGAASAVRAA